MTVVPVRGTDHTRGHVNHVCPRRTGNCGTTEFCRECGAVRAMLNCLRGNALEASRPGETAILACHATPDGVEFTVHNPGAMSRSAQLQIFQRSFSSKGDGRGLGTYSVKLLTERYLGGSVAFDSTLEHGTTFRARYPFQRSNA